MSFPQTRDNSLYLTLSDPYPVKYFNFFPAHFTHRKWILILILLFIGQLNIAHSQNVTTKGKKFWLAFQDNLSLDTLKVIVTSEVNTSGTVSMPLMGFTQNFTVSAFQSTSIIIPNTAETQSSGVVDSTGILVETEDTVSVFALNFMTATADATRILPSTSLGSEYRVSAYPGISTASSSQFLVLAVKDNTEVIITPTEETSWGSPAGVPFNVTLDKGQVFQVKAAQQGADFMGSTVVDADSLGGCSQFAVFSGAGCVNIPFGCTACDHIYEMNLQVDAWGQRYFVVPFDSASSYTYRVMAHFDNTTYTVNGGAPIVLNAGDFMEVNMEVDALCIEADKPISVTQYMQGATCSITGDPAMLILNSEDQEINNITFSTISSNIINDHYLNIVVKTANVNQVTLDGSPIDTSLFTPFTSCTDRSFAQIKLTTPGSHTLSAGQGGVTAYTYGFGSFESYAYSVGSFVPLDITVQDAACTTDTIVFEADTGMTNPWWSRFGDDDTLATGLTLTLAPPVDPGIYVVTGETNQSLCGEQYFFMVRAPNPRLFINAHTDPDSVCPGEQAQLSANVRFSLYRQVFNNVLDSILWTEVSGGIASNNCGSISGNALYFNGAGNRIAATTDINVPAGADIYFDLKIADGSAPCDDADPGEDIVLEYSTNGGGVWNLIETYDEASYPNFTNIDIPVPVAAQTPATRFRWRQLNHSGLGQDNWALDNINILIPDGGTYTYNWTPTAGLSDPGISNPVATPNGSATYRVEMNDSNNCVYTDTVHIAAGEDLGEVSLVADTVVCPGETVPLTVSGGAIFQWSPPNGLSSTTSSSPSANPTTPTTYTVRVFDELKCDSIDLMVNVGLRTPPALTFSNDTFVCEGSSVILSALNEEATYTWMNTTVGNFFTVELGGQYWVEGVNECDTIRDTINVAGITPPVVNLGNDTNICDDIEVLFDVTNNGIASYIWQDTAGGPTLLATTPGMYYVTVIDSFSCSNEDSVLITDICNAVVGVPNVFTPNGDGMNDIFTIYTENVMSYELIVFNRWGARVFQSNITGNGWDGFVKGRPAADGTYFWILDYVGDHGDGGKLTGSLTLIRD